MKLFGEEKHREAIEAYERALQEAPDWTEALHGIAIALMNREEYDQAIEVGRRICELDSKDPFAHTSLSIFYQKKSALAEAAGDEEASRELIELAEKEGAKAKRGASGGSRAAAGGQRVGGARTAAGEAQLER